MFTPISVLFYNTTLFSQLVLINIVSLSFDMYSRLTSPFSITAHANKEESKPAIRLNTDYTARLYVRIS